MNINFCRITRTFIVTLPLLLLACSLFGFSDSLNKSLVPTATSRGTRSDPSIGFGQEVSKTLRTDVALEKKIISRDGGVTYPDWGNANDGNDYGTTTCAENGRWGNHTNALDGTYEVVDLGREYLLTGVGYPLDWDGAFANSLTFQVLVSTDYETWTMVANTIHRYKTNGVSNNIDIDLAIIPTHARYVKYWEPPDGDWNGWGDFYQLRAYVGD